jgi:ribosomal-protein-serine acetyltransferase
MEKSPFHIAIDKDLEIRLLEEKDAAEMFALIEANREGLRQWLPWVDTTLTVEDAGMFITRATDQFYSDVGIHCAIIHQGRMAGVIGCVKMDLANRSCEIGYWLGEEHRGRGLMTTVCGAMLEYMFDAMMMNRAEIRCAIGNEKSIAIPIRLGFRKEGVARQAAWLNDRFIDLTIYSMLAEEWREQKKTAQNWP